MVMHARLAQVRKGFEVTSDEFSKLLSKFLKGEEVPYKEACMDADVEASTYESEGARKVANALADEFREIASRYERI